MGSFKLTQRWLLLLFFLPFVLTASNLPQTNQMLYLLHAGEVEKALNSYREYYKEKGKHDFELLQNLSLILLDKGIKSGSAEIALMTLYGAGISMNEKAFYLLEEGLNSSIPEIQIVALNFLALSQNDLALALINRLIASPHPILRLEAAYQLALKKSPLATSQIEALMYKMEELAPIFPKLFAVCGDHQAIKILRKLLTHPNSGVRCEAILSAADFERDDLTPIIRKLATHGDIAQTEVAAFALGELHDGSSLPLLQNLAQSTTPAIKLSALEALKNLGDQPAKASIQELAKTGDIFAIHLLGEIAGSEEILAKLAKSSSLQARINAACALLDLKDERCLAGIKEIVIRDPRDLAFINIYSLGKALTAIKAIPSSSQHFGETPLLHELSLHFREEILEKALELEEKVFLTLAEEIFKSRQPDLIPVLTQLLVTLNSQESVALLKKEQQKIGAPLIRNYCNLALFKLGEKGPYENNLKEWIKSQQALDLMRFRAFIPFDMREKETAFQLTPEESARLLIESFETIAASQEDKGIDLLLEAIIDGNPKNRYVLAGLLLRAMQ